MLKVLGYAVAVLAIIGAYFYPIQKMVSTFAASPAGTTVNSAKFAGVLGVALSGTGANGTSTSILNTDAFDRYVTSFKVGCEGLGTSFKNSGGISALQVTVATTTTSAPTTIAYNFAVALNATIATTSVNNLVSSSTLQTATSSNSFVWNSGSYMTFFWNATNTAICTEGVEYVQS